jgi:DNA invertase Pin-like site-specific DNA recombinase
MLIAALLFHAVLQRRETCPAVRCGPAPASPPHAAARRAEWHQECAAACSLVRARGAALKATEQPIDTSTAAGKCFLDMLGVFAEFETNLRRERQLEGIAKAKAAGVYKGRPASIDGDQVRAMKAQGIGASEIAKALKIGRASVYRVLEAG